MNTGSRTSPSLSFETQLKTVPHRNQRARVTPSADNPAALIVEAELAYHGVARLLTRFLKPKKSKKYLLEGLSREFYERIDGHRTVEQFIDDLMVRHKLTFFEARALVSHYFMIFMERGIIIISAPKQPPAE